MPLREDPTYHVGGIDKKIGALTPRTKPETWKFFEGAIANLEFSPAAHYVTLPQAFKRAPKGTSRWSERRCESVKVGV